MSPLTMRKPSVACLTRFLEQQSAARLSYSDVRATRSAAPEGYVVDHNRIRLGEGAITFERAVAAVRRWEMFNCGWLWLFPQDTPIEIGRTVAIVIGFPGLWSLNACRIVDTFDEDIGPVRRFGFAYGTLADHMESGEERFSIEWRRHEDDSVWYEIRAFSRPRHPLARIGRRFARMLQRQFARDSMQAMLRAARL